MQYTNYHNSVVCLTEINSVSPSLTTAIPFTDMIAGCYFRILRQLTKHFCQLVCITIGVFQTIEKGKYEAVDSARKAARTAMFHFKEVTK